MNLPHPRSRVPRLGTGLLTRPWTWGAVLGALFLLAFFLWSPSRVDYTSRVVMEDVRLDVRQSVDELERDGFRPREDLPAWPLRLPLDWGADPFGDRNWQFMLHAWRMNDTRFQAYFDSKDVSHLHAAVAIAEDWYRFHVEQGRKARFSWDDMATGLRASQLALLLDRIYSGELTVEDGTRAHLEELADIHARRLHKEDAIAANNRGLFQLVGLDLLCTVAAERPACDGAKDFARTMYDKLLKTSYSDEGVHLEHSPSYHFVADTLLASGPKRRWPDLTEPVLAKAQAIEPWLVFPDGFIARIGDSGGLKPTLREDPPDPVCLFDNRCYAVKDLTKSGYAIVRSLPSKGANKQSMLFVTGMAWRLTHKHADDLSFELYEGGRLIFVDSGKFGYEAHPMRRYVRGAAAHNTISLADSHIGPKDVEMVGTELEPIEHDRAGFTIAGATERPGLFSQTRRIAYDPGRSIVIHDELSAEAQRQYASSLHLAPDLLPKVDARGFTADLGSGRLFRAEVDEADCRIESARGQEEPVLGWISLEYKKVEQISVVRAICPGQRRTITWRVKFIEAN